MFDEVCKKLESIDSILDKNIVEELKKGMFSLDTVKKYTRDTVARFVLFEIEVKQGTQQKAFNYLRGFEGMYFGHDKIADAFLYDPNYGLENALKPEISELIKPGKWSSFGDKSDLCHPLFQKEDLSITLKVPGGGMYKINWTGQNKGSILYVGGDSMTFGAVKPAYKPILKEMIDILLCREAYEGMIAEYLH